MTIYRFPFPQKGLKNPEPLFGSGFFTLDDSVDGFAGFVALDVVEVVEGIVLHGGFSFP